MIVTITGAYKNVGDHLIGHRARALLKEFVDSEIININRKNIGDAEYDIMNKADAVILCGGPAYQKAIYPQIYPIELERINVPIIPMGLGWKSQLNQTPASFKFTESSKDFIKAIHGKIEHSSVRDVLTKQVINNNGIENVLMTGCPAWYDLEYFDKSYEFSREFKQIVVSMPAKYHEQVPILLRYLKSRFPDAKRLITFHHGFWTRLTTSGLYSFFNFAKMAVIGKRYGYSIVDLSGNIGKLSVYDAENSLHVGYRVHAHLYCLSHKTDSILINEDVRGHGQAESLNLESFDASDKQITEKLDKFFDKHYKTKGEEIKLALSTIKDTFPVMEKFLKTIK